MSICHKLYQKIKPISLTTWTTTKQCINNHYFYETQISEGCEIQTITVWETFGIFEVEAFPEDQV